MSKTRFTGPIGKFAARYLKLRRSLGLLLKNAEYTLDEFDKHLAKKFPRCKIITRPMIVDYLDNMKHLSPMSLRDRLTNLRQFCRFYFQYQQNVYIPEKFLVPAAKPAVKPHIYSEQEVRSLISKAGKMHPRRPFVSQTYKAIIGLLWVAGLRIGEATKLSFGDVDLVDGVIHIRQTKFFKSRLVPLSSSSVSALLEYKRLRKERGYSEAPDSPFFINRRHKRCDKSTTSKEIQKLIRKLDLKTIQGKRPRVHDLRHSFATHSLAEFYRSGKDPSVLLPVLATYLGHANISNTQVYLHPSMEVLAEAGRKFRHHALRNHGGQA